MPRIQYEKITSTAPLCGYYEKTANCYQRDLETDVSFDYDPYKSIIRCNYTQYGKIVKREYFRKLRSYGFTSNDVKRLIPYL